MTLTYLSFSIAHRAIAFPLTSSLLPPVLSSLAPRRCFKSWVLITYQFYLPSIFLWSFTSTNAPLSFNFQKACWDDFAYYYDSDRPSAEEYSSLSLSSAAALFTSLTLKRPNLPFLSAPSNANLKPDGPLRWKMQSVKDARLSLPLTEVMKIARLTS